MAAEAYRGALQRAGDVFPPDQQVHFKAKVAQPVNTHEPRI